MSIESVLPAVAGSLSITPYITKTLAKEVARFGVAGQRGVAGLY